jgi:hypothetical protein
MNPDGDEEIAASVGAHRDLGPAYDDAIAAGLVERIGAEVDRRVDERISRYQIGQISWPQAALALGSLIVGLITSVSINTAGDPWPVIIIWIAIVVINMAIFRPARG